MAKKHLIICILLTIFVYANSIQNDFTWDDEYLVVKNDHIKSLKNIPNFFLDKKFQTVSPGMTWYRPFRSVIYSISHFFFGLNPYYYHTINLIFHLLNVVIVYYLITVLSDCDRAFICSLIFSVHPILTEGVSSITGLADVLSTFFYITTLFLFIKFPAGRILFVSFICYLLSLFSKEMAVTLPGIIILYLIVFKEYHFLPLNKKKFFKNKNNLFICIFSTITILYLIIWKKGTSGGEFYYGYGGSYYNNILMIPKVLITYLRLITFPINQSIRYDVEFSYSLFEPNVFFSIILLTGITLTALFLFKKKKLFSFGILWFFITLIPVSNIVPLTGSMMGERFLYLPSIGLFIAFSEIIVSFREQIKTNILKRLCFNTLIFSIIVLFSILTIKRNFLWENNLLLFNDATKKAPDSLAVRLNLVREYEKINDFKSAETQYMEAVRINILNANLHVKWGKNHLKRNNITKAKEEFKMAVKTNPALLEPHIELALIFERLKDTDNAKKEWVYVLKLDKDNKTALERLSLLNRLLRN